MACGDVRGGGLRRHRAAPAGSMMRLCQDCRHYRYTGAEHYGVWPVHMCTNGAANPGKPSPVHGNKPFLSCDDRSRWPVRIWGYWVRSEARASPAAAVVGADPWRPVGDRLQARPARHLARVGRLRALVLDKLPAGDPKAPGRLQHVRFHDASCFAAATSASVNPRASRWRRSRAMLWSHVSPSPAADAPRWAPPAAVPAHRSRSA